MSHIRRSATVLHTSTNKRRAVGAPMFLDSELMIGSVEQYLRLQTFFAVLFRIRNKVPISWNEMLPFLTVVMGIAPSGAILGLRRD
jgi:hypothetical protein